MSETRHAGVNEILGSKIQGVTPYASPLVYRLARERNLDLQRLTGTARQGRISEEDIIQFIKSTPGPEQRVSGATSQRAVGFDFSHFGETERQSLTEAQKISAASLSHNWATIPHVTYHDEVDITDLEALRVLWNQEHSASDVNITQQAFVLKASATAIKAFPRFNASLDIDNGELILKKYLHIGFAIATQEGDVIPVVRDVDRKNVVQLAQEIATLSHKVHEGTLTAVETSGGCFTLSLLAGIGGLGFTPIINGSEVAILGISAPRWQLPLSESTAENRLILPLSLSYDQRVTDNATAACFMTYLKSLLTDIRLLIL